MPASVEEPLPIKPENYDSDATVKRQTDLKSYLAREANRKLKPKRIQVLMTIQIARQFAEYERMYFPHNLDSRGRAYPLPGFLNPQGPDFVKALIEFEEGHPVETQEQADWLYIVTANAYGFDKSYLADRVAWCHENEEMILSCATDYQTDHRWMKAGDPFQFLRMCKEYKEFKEVGLGYVSHCVAPVDATCSGLQHYAAMLRDADMGRAVNLVPGLPRQDVYGDVANITIRELVVERSAGNASGRVADDLLKFGVTRKETKRQVMVVPYAGKFSS
ncbi:hypothetical protein GP486_008754, partial [Trichoglossum hirsutum]